MLVTLVLLICPERAAPRLAAAAPVSDGGGR